MKIPEKIKNFVFSKKSFEKFPGFPEDPVNNYWRYPKVLDDWWCELSGSEQKILDYIIRHTWGYQKDVDSISLQQFEEGIFSSKQKKWIDRGTGLKKKAILRALNGEKNSKKGLIGRGFVVAIKKHRHITKYRLNTKRF